MVDIVQMKKGAEKVYPETHYQAIQGVPKSNFTTINLNNGLTLQLHKVGLYCQMSIFKKPTSVFSGGEISLGVIIPEEFRSAYFQTMKATAIDVSTPDWNVHYLVYMNTSGQVYIYTNGITNPNLTFYASHMYILK